MTSSPGRRRGTVLETAIFAAVKAELAQVGYANLTVSAVAERAGTSKPVLYRRWPDRPHLVYAAIAHDRRSVEPPPDTGTFRADLIAWMHALQTRARHVEPDTIWGLLAESANDTDLLATIRSDLVAPHDHQGIQVIIQRAVERDEITARSRTTRQLSLPSELLRSSFLLHGSINGSTIEEMVDDVITPALQ